MSKRVKMLIAGATALVILLGVLMAVVLMLPKDEEASTSLPDTAVALYEQKLDDVASVKVNNTYGEYEVVRTGSKEWNIEAFQDLPVDADRFTSLAETVSAVTALDTVETAPEDLEKYGLQDPVATATTTFKDKDNTVHTIKVGKESPESGKTYFMVDEDPTVYVIDTSTVNILSSTRFYYLDHTIAPGYDSLEDYPQVKKFDMTRKDLEYPISLVEAKRLTEDTETSIPQYTGELDMVEPVAAYVRSEKMDAFTHKIFGMSADEAVMAFPTQDMLEDIGLDDPYMTVKVATANDEWELIIGDPIMSTPPEDEEELENYEESVVGYYGMLKGRDIVYVFSPDSLPWLTMKAEDIASSLVLLPYIKLISQVKVNVEGQQYVFDIKYNIVDEEEVLEASYNGKVLDTQNFQNYYQLLLKAPGEEIYLGDEADVGEPIASIEYVYKDGRPNEKVEFSPAEDRMMYVTVNGETSFTSRMTYLERLISETSKVINNETVQYRW